MTSRVRDGQSGYMRGAVAAHHAVTSQVAEALRAYINAAGIVEDRKGRSSQPSG